MNRFVLGLIAMLFSACTTLPPAAKVAGFGEAVTATASSVQATFAASDEISIKIRQETAVLSLIDAGQYDRSEIKLDEKAVAVRQKAIASLQRYGKALSAAADQKKIEALDQAAVGLGAAAASVVSTGIPAVGPVAAPVGKLAGRAAGLAIASRHAERVRAVIAAADPAVKTLAKALIKDLAKVEKSMTGQADAYGATRERTASLVAKDARLSRRDVAAEGRQAEADILATEMMPMLATKAARAVMAMAEAHAALAAAGPDEAVLVARFVTLADDATALVKSLKED